MSTAIWSTWRRRAAALAAVGLAAASVMVAAASPAWAGFVNAKYKVTGSTYLAGPKATISLGPGQLSSRVNISNGALTAVLTMPPATGSFKQLGLITVKATTRFINDGPTTGTVDLNTGKVRTTSKITLQIQSLSVAGVPVPVGNRCETASPVVIKLRSQPGFNILLGGKVAGSYVIGDFSHCELATLLINQTIPASGNTITLKLGKATIG